MRISGLSGEGHHLDTQSDRREYDRLRYTGARKEATKARAMAHYRRNREARIAAATEWNKTHPEQRRATHLKRKYGLTPTEYAEMVVAQDARCGICRKAKPSLVVDHDHDTGRVRGLLCRTCNAAIGQLGDNPKLLRRALEWLEE